jgi:hypothetical protein
MVSTRTPRGRSPAAASAWATCRDARSMSSPSTFAVRSGSGDVSRSISPGRTPLDHRHVADHQVDQGVDRIHRQVSTSSGFDPQAALSWTR